MGFHSSALREFAKKHGSHAHEPRFRPLSKKQVKRKTNALALRTKVVDAKKEKIRSQTMAKQTSSLDLSEEIAKAEAR